ncbi:DUF4871 domain-containing protein [Metabacillus litoralis]|uniref:DUF4871 domain-containing protein n=1 Tax=Metabacillus litoralis TaxID=152268 RepID=UPI001CFC4734|nr:DUF4871 domain-containing protein [Metabacillus litoralis]
MRKWYLLFIFLIIFAGCEANKVDKDNNSIKLPNNIPSYVKKEDIREIDWSQKAVEFDSDTGSEMFGVKDKVGIIGPMLKPNQVEKWMWHFWGVNEGEMTVVGINRSTTKIYPILINGQSKDDRFWSKELAGEINGADYHTPSNVMISEAGEWAFMVYINGELFETFVMEVRN